MKFTLKKLNRNNVPEIMRQARYRYMGQSGTQASFVRALGQNPYPRFHIYLQEDKAKKEVYVTLHLDQKNMSYKGSTAHSGDYDGNLLKEEAERIKGFFEKT